MDSLLPSCTAIVQAGRRPADQHAQRAIVADLRAARAGPLGQSAIYLVPASVLETVEPQRRANKHSVRCQDDRFQAHAGGYAQRKAGVGPGPAGIAGAQHTRPLAQGIEDLVAGIVGRQQQTVDLHLVHGWLHARLPIQAVHGPAPQLCVLIQRDEGLAIGAQLDGRGGSGRFPCQLLPGPGSIRRAEELDLLLRHGRGPDKVQRLAGRKIGRHHHPARAVPGGGQARAGRLPRQAAVGGA